MIQWTRQLTLIWFLFNISFVFRSQNAKQNEEESQKKKKISKFKFSFRNGNGGETFTSAVRTTRRWLFHQREFNQRLKRNLTDIRWRKKKKNSQLLTERHGGGAIRQQSESGAPNGLAFDFLFSPFQVRNPTAPFPLMKQNENCLVKNASQRFSSKNMEGGINILFQGKSYPIGLLFTISKQKTFSFLFSFCPYKSHDGYFTKKHSSPPSTQLTVEGEKKTGMLFYWLQFQLRKRNRCDSSFLINRFSLNKKAPKFFFRKRNEQISRKRHFKYAAWVVFLLFP